MSKRAREGMFVANLPANRVLVIYGKPSRVENESGTTSPPNGTGSKLKNCRAIANQAFLN